MADNPTITCTITDKEKLRLVAEVVPISQREDFRSLATHSNLEVNDLGLLLYRQHEETGESIGSIVQHALCSYRDEMTSIVHGSGLSRTTQWRIMQRPIGEWESLVDKSNSRTTRPRNYGLHIVISNDSNQIFSGLPFIDRVVYSVLCKAFQKHEYEVSYEDLWRTINQSRYWYRERDKEGFRQAIRMSVARLENIFHEFVDCTGQGVSYHCRGSFHKRNGGLLPKTYEEASAKRLLVTIPADMVATGSHLDIVHRLYIAYRIRLTERKNSKMRTAISLATMERDTGATVSVNAVRGYMESLAKMGRIESPSVGKDRITWKRRPEC